MNTKRKTTRKRTNDPTWDAVARRAGMSRVDDVPVWSAFCEAMGTRCTFVDEHGERCDNGVDGRSTVCAEHAGRFVVCCRVSGGVTGTRESLLKRNGVVRVFETFGAATKEAARLRSQMNNQHAVAFFQYWVAPAPEGV